MKKLFGILIISLFIFTLSLAGRARGAVSSDFINHQAPSDYFYPQEFDKLVLDLTIPSGTDGEDKLQTITLENGGSAKDYYDIEKVKIWREAGPTGFQGMEVDKELGAFTYYSQNQSWYLDNLAESVPVEGLRIFISVEISKNATANRTLQMKIPLLSDANSNSVFDLGDLGIFMEPQKNGPTDEEVSNSYYQTIRDWVIDSSAPKTVITDPEDNSIITSSSYTISGVARDQGGSTPAWVKVGINDVWYDVTNTGLNYTTWEYEWQEISEGSYTIRTKSADWIGNNETPTSPITITVDFPEECSCTDWVNNICGGGNCEAIKMHQTRTCAPAACENESQCIADSNCIVEEPIEKPISEMTVDELEAKIVEIQQKIIELLNQLIQLIQAQITELY